MKRIAVTYREFTTLMLATSCVCLSAVESQPVRVVSVQSGLRVTVEASVGGLRTEIPVQLQGITLIGPVQYSQQKANELCPPGSQVVLQAPGDRLDSDEFGVVRAWVLRDFPAAIDPAAPPSAAGAKGHYRSTIQVELIRAGWAVPEVKPERSLPFLLEASMRTALEEARTRHMGAYSLAGYEVEPDAQNGNPIPPSELMLPPARDPLQPMPPQRPVSQPQSPTVEPAAGGHATFDNGF